MSHAIPPELLGAVPRRIRRRKGHGWLLGFVHFFILPHTLVGIVMTGVFLFFVVHALFASTVPGRVTNLRESTSSKGSTTYRVDFAYDLGDHPTTGSSNVSRERHQTLARGDHVDLKVLHLGPFTRASLAGSASPPLPFLALWLAIWNGVLSVFHWNLTIVPLLRRHLVRSGSPVEGTVTAKRVQSGKQVAYYVTYAYSPQPGAPLTREMNVREKDYAPLAEGTPVTVLYDPAKPRRSVVYELADYEAVFA